MNKLKPILTCILIVFAVLISKAQSEIVLSLSAKNTALAGCALSSDSIWSAILNPASLGQVSTITATCSYQSIFAGCELSQKAFALTVPIVGRSIGICIQQQGDRNLHQNYMAFSYAHTITQVIGIGLRFGIVSMYFPEDNKSAGTYSISIGARMKKDRYQLGFTLFNLQTGEIRTINQRRREELIYSSDLNYCLSKQCLLCAAIRSVSLKKAKVSVAMEYELIESVRVRFGTHTQPLQPNGGFGFAYKKCVFDFGIDYHQQLGSSPVFSLSYQL